jgi:hypothetical protein
MGDLISTVLDKRFRIGVVAVILTSGIALGLLLSRSSDRQNGPGTPPSAQNRAPKPTQASKRCPLTDLRRRGGVPDRPALAIKIGNEPYGARPQSGLGEADIVFDTPAEGFIMRYIAIFQCKNAASIGPIRSVRWVDWHLVRQFVHPILAFAGGINPNVNQVANFNWLRSANLLGQAQSAGERISSRLPPDNLYTSSAALYALFPKSNRPPKPVFSFSTAMPGGAVPAKSLSINFSYGTDVIWKWVPSLGSWIHTYNGVRDVDALTNKVVAEKNIIVILVRYHFGPFAESTGGSGDFESQTVGRGSAYVLRNGRSIKTTWHRKYLVSPFTFTRAKGERVTLTPGRTWVELVPVGTPFSIAK